MKRNTDPTGFESFLYVLVVLACLVTVPVVFYEGQGVSSPLLTILDWGIWAVFVLEYGILLALARGRKHYAGGHWLSIAIIVLSFPQLPAQMGLVRLVRLSRILLLFLVAAKAFRTTKLAVSHKGFLYMLITTVFLVMVAAQLLHLLEPLPGGFTDGLWWALVTTTTVGYGDIIPSTGAGRLIAVVLMMVGTILVATIAASVSAYFVGAERSEEYEDITRRLERIERMVEEQKPG